MGNDSEAGPAKPADPKSRRQFLKWTGAGGAALLSGSLPAIARPAETLAEEQSASGINLALNRAAYQSGSSDDDHTAHLTTDGSPTTFWQSKPHQENRQRPSP
jgi:hypothetical protein